MPDNPELPPETAVENDKAVPMLTSAVVNSVPVGTATGRFTSWFTSRYFLHPVPKTNSPAVRTQMNNLFCLMIKY
jgi:hypothetical protein